MATYSSLLYHVIFSTKGRKPTITNAARAGLHAYLSGAIRNGGGIPLAVGGVEDHVHLLLSLRPVHSVADVVREIKKSSSGWMKDNSLRSFCWQEGYAALTLGKAGVGPLRAYIGAQEEHHKRTSSHDELLAILEEAGVEIDMRYFE